MGSWRTTQLSLPEAGVGAEGGHLISIGEKERGQEKRETGEGLYQRGTKH